MKAREMFLRASAVLAALAVGAVAAQAQTATVTVNYQVDGIQRISTSANSVTLHITNSPVVGVAEDSVSDASLTYAITTNMTGSKISGYLSAAMPTGTGLDLSMAAPAVGTSAGQVTLTNAISTSAVDLVTGITKTSGSGYVMTFWFETTPAAGVLAAASRTLTLTIGSGT
jgi:hypothetical protein